jgi:ribonuclease HII
MAAPSYTPRRDAGLAAYENVLARAGLAPVAGIDEAGRGACAGPLVVAAVVLDKAAIKRIQGLADSKLLTEAAREAAYESIVRHALEWHAVVIPHTEIDAIGLHICNIEGMRRAYAGLRTRPGYVLTDGFPVQGLGVPALAMWKGDRVAASVAAASIVAKVTRDRMMHELDERYPVYGFCRHKGYVTAEHLRALAVHGGMSAEDLEKYEAEMELQLYREYRDVVGLFTHVVETERRFYLTNDVDLKVRAADNGEVFFEVTMHDAWVWDMYRPARFVKNVRVVTFKDVNIEELAKSDLELPDENGKPGFSG